MLRVCLQKLAIGFFKFLPDSNMTDTICRPENRFN